MKASALPFLLATLIVLPRSAAAGGWYGAADVGGAFYSGYSGVDQNLGSTTGYRLGVGYQYSPYFALEGDYVDLGRAEASYSQNPCEYEGLGQFACDPQTDTVSLAATGFVLDGRGTLPINEQWSVFAETGLMASDSSSRITQHFARGLSSDGDPSGTHTKGNSSIEPATGVGVAWAFSHRAALRLSWTLFALQAIDPITRGSLNYTVQWVSLGLVYSF
jgi:OOP family OmpA-OmpF porin